MKISKRQYVHFFPQNIRESAPAMNNIASAMRIFNFLVNSEYEAFLDVIFLSFQEEV